MNGVLKREVVDGDKVQEAKGRMKKAEQKLARGAKKAAAQTATAA